MINLTVINLKSIIKIFIKIIIVTLIVTMIFEFIKIIKKIQIITKIKEKISNIQIEIIQSSTSIFNKDEINFKNNNLLETEFLGLNGEEEKSVNNIIQLSKNIEVEKVEVSKQQEEKEEIKDVVTKIIKENNKNDTFTNTYGSIKIKNESSYILDAETIVPNINFSNKKDIIIYHTHTCESYTQTEESKYVPTGNYRTTDLNFSVSKVGDELKQCLEKKGYNVLHDKTYHDYPAYNGSYTRSLSTLEKIKSSNPQTQLVIDLHRDALGNGTSYGPTIMIGDEQVAQLMFVIGTNGGGLKHDNWKNNLKFAMLIQQKANELYPGLFKPIIVRDSRYNQHMAEAGCIIEVGATANTLKQASASMKYLAQIISEVMK